MSNSISSPRRANPNRGSNRDSPTPVEICQLNWSVTWRMKVTGRLRLVPEPFARVLPKPFTLAEVLEVLPPDVTTMDLAEAPRIVGGGAGLDAAARADRPLAPYRALNARTGTPDARRRRARSGGSSNSTT